MRQLQRQAEETALIPTFEEQKTPSEVLSASIAAYKSTYQVDE
jgi:hypothetical protein